MSGCACDGGDMDRIRRSSSSIQGSEERLRGALIQPGIPAVNHSTIPPVMFPEPGEESPPPARPVRGGGGQGDQESKPYSWSVPSIQFLREFGKCRSPSHWSPEISGRMRVIYDLLKPKQRLADDPYQTVPATSGAGFLFGVPEELRNQTAFSNPMDGTVAISTLKPSCGPDYLVPCDEDFHCIGSGWSAFDISKGSESAKIPANLEVAVEDARKKATECISSIPCPSNCKGKRWIGPYTWLKFFVLVSNKYMNSYKCAAIAFVQRIVRCSEVNPWVGLRYPEDPEPPPNPGGTPTPGGKDGPPGRPGTSTPLRD